MTPFSLGLTPFSRFGFFRPQRRLRVLHGGLQSAQLVLGGLDLFQQLGDSFGVHELDPILLF